MHLFHASEEPDITVFYPRLPSRRDLDPTVGLVWAIDEEHLPNFLTPRNCPRVTFHIRPETTEDDRRRFFFSDTVRHAVIIEHDWFDRMRNTTLYLYEFDPAGFVMQDEIAGYYVSVTAQTPIARHIITDLPGALIARGVELRITDNLRRLAEDVKTSTLGWSLCRMGNAKQ